MKQNNDTVNLYVSSTYCPKCTLLKTTCEEVAKNNKDWDYKIIVINPCDENDTDLQLLSEKGIQFFPVLLVNNEFMDFGAAMKYLRSLS